MNLQRIWMKITRWNLKNNTVKEDFFGNSLVSGIGKDHLMKDLGRAILAEGMVHAKAWREEQTQQGYKNTEKQARRISWSLFEKNWNQSPDKIQWNPTRDSKSYLQILCPTSPPHHSCAEFLATLEQSPLGRALCSSIGFSLAFTKLKTINDHNPSWWSPQIITGEKSFRLLWKDYVCTEQGLSQKAFRVFA